MVSEVSIDNAAQGYKDGVVDLLNRARSWQDEVTYSVTPAAMDRIKQTCSAFLTLVEQWEFKRLPLCDLIYCYNLGYGLCQAVQWGSWAVPFVSAAEELALDKTAGASPFASVPLAYDLDSIAAVFRPVKLEVETDTIQLEGEGDED